jgi:Family of unknown function (DUF6455)
MHRTFGSRPSPPQKELLAYRRLMSHRPFSRMLERLNIGLAGPWWRGFEDLIFRAVGRCASCPRTADCRRWLAQGHPGELSPGFCRNAGAIAACRILAAEAKGDPDLSGEPPLAEVLGDPGVRQMMASDHVDREAVEELLKPKS